MAERSVISLGIIRLAIIAALFGAVPSIGAGGFSSVRDLPDELKNVRKGRLANADITLLGVRIGRETLAEIQSRFGDTETFRHPPHGDSFDVEICYASLRAGEPVWVVFGSGAMGGWQTVTLFQVLSKAPTDARCTPSTLGDGPIATDSGIRLGMPVKAVRAKLGRPTEQGACYAVFGFEQKSDHPERRDFDMLSALSTTIGNERLTSFQVSLIESN